MLNGDKDGGTVGPLKWGPFFLIIFLFEVSWGINTINLEGKEENVFVKIFNKMGSS